MASEESTATAIPMETEEPTPNPAEDDDDEPPPLEDGSPDELDSSSSDEDKGKDPEVALAKAMALKEEGNNFFIKEKDFEKASRSYRKGVNSIKHLNQANAGDAQVKSLLLTLQTNLSMMSFKLGKHKQSLDIATKALEIDPNHVKARYRRAVAHRKLGNSEEAINDLKKALEVDSSNTSVRKELVAIQKEIQRAKKAQKESLRKAFSKGGLLNDNRVEDEAAKALRLAKEAKEKEEALRKRKQEWEDDCVSRMAKGEDAISYEDWDKEQIAKAKEAEEEATRKRKEDEKRRKEERKKAKAAKKAEQENDSDDEDTFTEKELAAMRGYKKTADGRITSYFSREQSAEEKAMLDIAPKPISDCTPKPITPNASSSTQGSSWNHAGTWEEKDTTDWCKNHLEKRLLETKVEASGVDGDGLVCSVVEVKDVNGDASVAIVSGKKRYIFDLHCKVVFEIKEESTDDVIAKGSLRLPDICSTSHDELEVESSGWKKRPSSENQTVANDCRSRIVSEIRESIKLWVQDFNKQY